MSGPLGGDHLTVRADAQPGVRLRVGPAAAALALPGPHRGGARYEVRLTVAAGGEPHWLPEQLISAEGSDLTSPHGPAPPAARGSCCARSRCSGGPGNGRDGSPPV